MEWDNYEIISCDKFRLNELDKYNIFYFDESSYILLSKLINNPSKGFCPKVIQLCM